MERKKKKKSLNTETCGCIKLKDTSEFCEFPGYIGNHMTTFCIYTFQLNRAFFFSLVFFSLSTMSFVF